jgi:hypothetical protein
VIDGFQQACSTMNPLPPENFPIDDPRNNPGDASNTPLNPKNICKPGIKVCPAAGAGVFGACGGEIKPCNVATNNNPPVKNGAGGPVHPNPTCLDLCNGFDDDCDNNVDEDFQSADCSNNCNSGVTTCTNGVLGCTLTPITVDDTCDGVDDDCDGLFDEDYDCDLVTPGKQTDCPCSDAFTCNGVKKCINGAEVCEGTPNAQESCDCKDNNCNNIEDEGAICGANAICNQFCQCALPCSNTEFPCPLGKFCSQETLACSNAPACNTNAATCVAQGNCCAAGGGPTTGKCDPRDACTQDPSRTDCCCRRLCITDPCFNMTCAAQNGEKFVCQVSQPDPNEPPVGTCVPACTVAMCAPDICIPETGLCAPDNCTTFPDRCDAVTQNCINGACITNPCVDKQCPSDQYCVGGSCVSTCADVNCPTGERCRLGVCEADPCGKACPPGQACNDNSGQCVDNTGCGAPCAAGQWCNPNNNGGECEDDPCAISEVVCPTGTVCLGGTCFDPADFLPDGGTEVRVTTGGGGCSTGGGGLGGIGALFALALLLLRRSRRTGGRS